MVGDISRSVEGHDFFDFIEFGGNSSVHAENFFFDKGSYGHGVKAVDKNFPYF